MSRLAGFLAVVAATGFGAGFSPLAPGTAGSAVGVLAALAAAFAHLPPLVLAVPLFPVGVWAAAVCGRRYGSHDDGRIVIDEIVGQLVALAWIPARPGWFLAGFLVFRFFDIVKPFPAGHIDRRWHTPFGVMADDVVAGVYANLALQVARAALAP